MQVVRNNYPALKTSILTLCCAAPPSNPFPHLPIYPSTHLPIYPSTHLPIYPSTHLPIYPSTHLPIYPSTHLPILTMHPRSPRHIKLIPIAGLFLLSGLLLSAKAAIGVPSPAKNSVCAVQLEQAIGPILSQPTYQRSRWGILIQTASTTTSPSVTLYAHDAQRYFIPASNAKLLTTAAALQKLGPAFRIRTSVYQTNASSVLRVVGRGDPSLTDAELKTLAQQLSAQGIRQVAQLLGDDQYFQGEATNPGWDWEDGQAGYGAPVNSLILNQNAIGLQLIPQSLGQPLQVAWENPVAAAGWRIENRSRTVATSDPEFLNVGRDLGQPILKVSGQLRVGSDPEPVAVAVLNPAQTFLRRFQQILATEQITVAQTGLTSQSLSPTDVERGAIVSPPLVTLLIETNQQSNNLYAEVLLRSLGKTCTRSGCGDTSEAGLAVMKTTLTGLGVDPKGYVLTDGSGLSRRNLVSPEALVQTLQAMNRSPYAPVFRASLSVAGTSGTLRNRFKNTPAQGVLAGKTGFVSGVAALSGYLDRPRQSSLVFSIIVNQSDQPYGTLNQAIDAIGLAMTRLPKKC